jgi:uncharacterized protein (DUF2062 family)
MCTVTGFKSDVPHRLTYLWNKISAPVTQRLQGVLSCGLTPRKLAQTICIGTALGIMPLVWGTSLICVIVAHVLKLNQVALQSVNYLLYPVQLVLLIPFFKLGMWLFPWGPNMPTNTLSGLIQNPGLSSLNLLGWIMLKSLAAWIVTALPVALLVYGIVWIAAFKK